MRRFTLEAQRRLATRWPPAPDIIANDLSIADALPSPIFPPREGAIGQTERGWWFTFLNRTRDFPEAIPWALPDDGPRDQLWKMNLHYMEYLDEVDDTTLISLIESWIEHNRPYAQGFWRDAWNSYSLSIRVVVWMQCLSASIGAMPAAFRDRVLASIHEQVSFLEKFLETDIGGNHLIKNIKALLWASSFFSGAIASHWRHLGITILRTELREQVLPDGMHFERSPSYHCQVFADLLECRHALGQDPLEGQLDEALHRMAKATACLVHPDGHIALFNDAGLTMAYTPSTCLRAYQTIFGHTILPDKQIALGDAGYFGYRDGGTYFLADCGPIAPDHLPAHGHGDILSFELSAEGRRIFVDPGVCEYNPGAMRQESRSTLAHNTVTIDDAEQCDFFASFRCGRRARGQVLDYQAKSDGMVLEGTHNGFDHLPGSPNHVRRFEVESSRVLIEDRVTNAGKHDVTARFLLHPDCTVDVQGQKALVTIEGHRVLVRTDGSLQLEERQWFPDMGFAQATKAILCRFDGRPKCRTEITF